MIRRQLRRPRNNLGEASKTIVPSVGSEASGRFRCLRAPACTAMQAKKTRLGVHDTINPSKNLCSAAIAAPLPTSGAHPNTDSSIKFTISAATCAQPKIAVLRQIELPPRSDPVCHLMTASIRTDRTGLHVGATVSDGRPSSGSARGRYSTTRARTR